MIQPDHLASLTGSAIAENVMRRRFEPERIMPGLKILPLIAARQIRPSSRSLLIRKGNRRDRGTGELAESLSWRFLR